MEAVRRPFPSVPLLDLDGRPRTPGPGAAAGSLVVIGHSDCETTRLILPYVERLSSRRLAGAAVWVVLQDDPKVARALLAELGLSLPVLLEPEPYPLAAALDLTTVPTLFLLEPDGAVALRSLGFRRDDLEAVAARLGAAPLFTAEDPAPRLRPG